MPDVPESFQQLAPELLIHSDWERIPPPPPPWWERAGSRLHALIEEEPWLRWKLMDWLYVLTFVSIGVGVIAEMLRVYRLARNS